MSRKFAEKSNVSKFRYCQLTKFFVDGQVGPKKVVQHKVHPQQRDLSFFGVYCPYCGASGADWIVRRGSRDNKLKGAVERFGCKRCKKRFSRKGWGHYPLWVVASILSHTIEGLGLSEIVEELKEEASRHGKTIKISRQTVSNITRRCVNAFLKFEEVTRPRFTLIEWQIDDTPQRATRDLCDHSKQPQNDDEFWFWVTNVLDSDSRYWLATYVSFLDRDAEVSETTVRMAVKRAHGTPDVWKCDGLKAHLRGIKNVIPHATIFSKTKAEKPEHINLIEGAIHGSMRRKGVKKRKKFRSIATLQTIVDLVRIWYNFLNRLDSLGGGITPAAKAGVDPVFRSWVEFVQYVFRRV